jgi:hypothetical protein
MTMKKISRSKKRMLEERKKSPNYGSGKLRRAYETKTTWLSKNKKKKE